MFYNIQTKLILTALVKITALLTLTFSPYALSMKITFVNPSHLGSIFWDAKVDFMRSCAKDLNIDLDIIYLQASHKSNLAINIKQQILKNGQPDYLIGSFNRANTYKLLNLAQELDIGYYSINTKPFGEHKKLIASPRARFKNWLGMMYPDDKGAGYTLAKYLFDKKAHLNRNIHVVAIGGGETASANIERMAGLNQALQQYPNVKLIRTAHTDWSASDAELKTKKLLNRYSKIDIIWAASDELAIGARRAIDNAKSLENTILTGGFDWSSKGLAAIEKGTLSATVGGHFIEGGLAMVLLADYHQQIDFKADPGLVITTQMQLIDSENISALFPSSGKIKWQPGECRRLSKSLSGSASPYKLNWENIRPVKH